MYIISIEIIPNIFRFLTHTQKKRNVQRYGKVTHHILSPHSYPDDVLEHNGCLKTDILKVSFIPARCATPVPKQRKILDNLPYFSGRSKLLPPLVKERANKRAWRGQRISLAEEAERRRNVGIPEGTEATSYEWIRDLIRNKRREEIFCGLAGEKGKKEEKTRDVLDPNARHHGTSREREEVMVTRKGFIGPYLRRTPNAPSPRFPNNFIFPIGCVLFRGPRNRVVCKPRVCSQFDDW